MKKFAVCLLLVLAFLSADAFAESPVGTWTGRGSIAWLSFSCKATFKENGRVVLSSDDYSLSGSWSGNTIRVKNDGDTIKIHFSISDSGVMSMSSSYGGYSGRATLRCKNRKESQATIRTRNGIWQNEDGETVRIYSAGYLHYSWEETTEDGEVIPHDYIASLTESEEDSAVLLLQSLDLQADEDQEVEPVQVGYTVSGDTLTITYENEEYVYAFVEEADAKPESDLFAAYVSLEKGDRGTAVETLQQQLTQGGFLDDKIDGIFGAKTEAAVLSFEQANGLSEDGIASPEVRTLLLETYPITNEAEN